jgi:hypothetical protein
MSHMYFPKGKQLALGVGMGSGSGPSGGTGLKMALLRLDGSVTDTQVATVTGATAASPIVLTTTLGNTAVVGDRVVVMGVGGTLGANGTYRVSARTATTITLQTLNGTNTTGVGAYTSGGCIVNMTQAQYLSDLDACIVGTPVALSGSSYTNGVFNATGPVAHNSVPAGVVTAYVIYYDTGTAATSPLIFFSDSKQRIVAAATANSAATAIVTPGAEGTIPNSTVLTWSNGINSTLTAQATAIMDGLTLAVSALGSAINVGHSCDAPWANSLFPVTLGSTGTITVTPDPGSTYVGEPVGFGEI